MAETDDRAASGSEIVHLSAAECWSLLSQAEVGRLGIAARGTVEIFPVNFVVDRERIVFRTSPGEKLLALSMTPAVAFEIDGWDDRQAWSVVVKGTATRLDDDSAFRAASRTGLKSWVPDPKNAYVQITPAEVTGRRFERGPTAETVWYW